MRLGMQTLVVRYIQDVLYCQRTLLWQGLKHGG